LIGVGSYVKGFVGGRFTESISIAATQLGGRPGVVPTQVTTSHPGETTRDPRTPPTPHPSSSSALSNRLDHARDPQKSSSRNPDWVLARDSKKQEKLVDSNTPLHPEATSGTPKHSHGRGGLAINLTV